MDASDIYWDAAFTYGELTCQRCDATLSTNADDDYLELALRAKGLGWIVEDASDSFTILCPECAATRQLSFQPGIRELMWVLIAVGLALGWWLLV